MRNKPYPFYEVEQINTLQDLLLLCSGKYAEKKAFWFADKNGNTTEISFKQFACDVEKLGSFLQHLGMRYTHIAVYGENSYSWIITYFAAVCAGNVIVPIDKDLPIADAEDTMKRADCAALFYSPSYSDEVTQMHLEGIATFCLTEVEGIVNKKDSEKTDFCETYITPEMPAAIIYTSGTTGKSKGVILTHGNLASDAVNSSRSLFVPCGTILLLPLHHSFGIMAGVLCQLLRGYPVFINQSVRFLQRDIQLAKPGHLSVVPLIMDALLKNIWDNAEKQGKSKLLRRMIGVSNALLSIGIDLRRVLFKSVINGLGGNLNLLISGGSAISQKTVDGLSAFGIKMINGYGITECSAIVATTRNKHSNFPSVGSVIPGCEIRIVNATECGEGEILLKGSTVFSGYYADETSTELAFDGEWFKTGDIGRVDCDGFLYITGRIKNLIVLSNGENVSPEELENRLLEIDEITEAVVYAENEMLVAEVYSDVENSEDVVEKKIAELNKSLPMHHQLSRIKHRKKPFDKTTTKKIIRATVSAEK